MTLGSVSKWKRQETDSPLKAPEGTSPPYNVIFAP